MRFIVSLVAFLSLLGTSAHAQTQKSCSPGFETLGMDYVELDNGRGGVRRVSRLVLGTDHLAQGGWTGNGQPEPTDEQVFAVLDEAARLGINLFDTAPIYVGGVENKLGAWRRSRAAAAANEGFYRRPELNPDRRLYTLTKGGFPFDLYWAKKLAPGTHSPELTAALEKLPTMPPGTYESRLFGDGPQITRRVGEELAHSSTNLDGDITVYLMHRDDGDAVMFNAVPRAQTSVETIMQALGDDAISKKVWVLGWSNWENHRVDESLALRARQPTLPKPAINSPYFSLFEMSPRTIHALGVQVTHRQMMDPDFQKGIKIMPYSPLGGFSILDKPEPSWENARRSAKEKYDAGDPYWQNVYHAIFTPENEARWNRVVDFTKGYNEKNGTRFTVDQMINAYALAHPRTDLLAVGAITPEQVRRTVEALGLAKKLTPADLEYLYSGTR